MKCAIPAMLPCTCFTLLHMNRLNKIESAIFVSMVCSLLPEDLHSELIISPLQLVLCRVAAVIGLPVRTSSCRLYIFWSFVVWMIVGQGPIALAVAAGGGLFGHFFLSSISSPFFLPLFGRRPDID